MKNLIPFILILFYFASCKKDNTNPSNNPSTPPVVVSGSWTTLTCPGNNSNYVISACAIGSNIFVGTRQGVYISGDNGNTWKATTVASNGSLASDTATCNVTSNGSTLYLTTQAYSGNYPWANGMFQSSDKGNTWATVWSPLSSDVEGGSYFNAFPYSVYFNGSTIIVPDGIYVFKSTNGGSSWSTGGVAGVSFSGNIVTDGTNFYAFDVNSISVYKSTDGGSTFNKIINDSVATNISGSANLVAMGSKLYIADRMAYHGVYMSANGGNSWTQVNNGLKDVLYGIGNDNIYSFITDGNNLFVGSVNQVLESTNGGSTWTQLGATLPSSTTTLLEANGYIFAMSVSGGIYRISL